jgi:methylphosphotriester-DNA--protein-cysteine methyltransferase
MKKAFIILLLTLCSVSLFAQAKFQPLIPLKPDKTVFLYANNSEAALKTIDDPVVAKEIECLALPIKEECGITIHQYINKERVRLLGELLQTQSISFQSACSQLGIEDVSYGYRLFKRHMGMTPKEYLEGKQYDTQKNPYL